MRLTSYPEILDKFLMASRAMFSKDGQRSSSKVDKVMKTLRARLLMVPNEFEQQ